MRIFDPHIHMTSLTTRDYEAMYAAGVRAVVEPSFWVGQPRTSVGTFTDYFDSLLGWEPFRASQFGIEHFCAISLNPKEANDPRCTGVLDVLPRYLAKDRVVAVGEIGYDSMTPEEDDALSRQLDLARQFALPVLVHTPHRDKAAGTQRTLDVVRESGIDPGMVLIDHLNEVTVPLVAGSGCWMGFSVYPDTKMTEQRLVTILREYGTERMLVNSAADWGRSDPLTTLRTAQAMLAGGFTGPDTEQVTWHNPVTFYAQSGRLTLPTPDAEPLDTTPQAIPATAAGTYAGNSVLRGGE